MVKVLKAFADIIFTIWIFIHNCTKLCFVFNSDDGQLMTETSEPFDGRNRIGVSGSLVVQLAVEAECHDPEVDVGKELNCMGHCNRNVSVGDPCNFVVRGYLGKGQKQSLWSKLKKCPI